MDVVYAIGTNTHAEFVVLEIHSWSVYCHQVEGLYHLLFGVILAINHLISALSQENGNQNCDRCAYDATNHSVMVRFPIDVEGRNRLSVKVKFIQNCSD